MNFGDMTRGAALIVESYDLASPLISRSKGLLETADGYAVAG